MTYFFALLKNRDLSAETLFFETGGFYSLRSDFTGLASAAFTD
jgi:hypothetical protein